MRVALLFVSVFIVSLHGQTTWPCKFTDPNGLNYDFTQVNKNTTDSKGQWQQIDTKAANWYYWKLCDPTTETPSGYLACANGTQVCQQPGTPPDKSCGIGPPTIGYLPNGTGVTMSTVGGYVGCGSTARSVVLSLLCATTYGKPDKSIDLVVESAAGCQYTISQYLLAACGSSTPPTPPPSTKPPKTPSSGLSGGSVFLIIFFVSLFVYFAAGIGYNYYKGAQGAELIPQVEFWKDLPFLVKDGVMFCVGLCTGGSNYSSV